MIVKNNVFMQHCLESRRIPNIDIMDSENKKACLYLNISRFGVWYVETRVMSLKRAISFSNEIVNKLKEV